MKQVHVPFSLTLPSFSSYHLQLSQITYNVYYHALLVYSSIIIPYTVHTNIQYTLIKYTV